MFKKITDFIFFISLFEIFIGGGGNFFKYQGISLRMLFFSLNLIFFIIYMLRKIKFNKHTIIISFMFILLHIFSLIVGIYNQAPLEYLKANFQGSLIFVLLPYYTFKIDQIQKIEHVISLMKKSAILLLVFHFLLLYLLYINFFNFSIFYQIVSEYQDIKFRDNVFFFYSGFLYTCIGVLIYMLEKNLKSKLMFILLFISVIVTLTRGFIFFTAFVVSLYYLIISKSIKLKISLIVLSSIFIILIIPFLSESRSEKSKYISDDVRTQTLDQVLNKMSLSSIMLGHGFGNGVEIRPIAMENSFMDIFHKQGILGLFFWVFILLYIFKLSIDLKNTRSANQGVVFMLGSLFIYLQSFSNPFVNNTIGIPFLLISIASLITLNKNKYDIRLHGNI
jgi:hypothetical protein